MQPIKILKQGDLVKMNISELAGYEQKKVRYSIVVSSGFIDPSHQQFAVIVPISSEKYGYPFEVEVPSGIVMVNREELTGVALTDQFGSLDLNALSAQIVGQVDIQSEFFNTIILNVRSTLY